MVIYFYYFYWCWALQHYSNFLIHYQTDSAWPCALAKNKKMFYNPRFYYWSTNWKHIFKSSLFHLDMPTYIEAWEVGTRYVLWSAIGIECRWTAQQTFEMGHFSSWYRTNIFKHCARNCNWFLDTASQRIIFTKELWLSLSLKVFRVRSIRLLHNDKII